MNIRSSLSLKSLFAVLTLLSLGGFLVPDEASARDGRRAVGKCNRCGATLYAYPTRVGYDRCGNSVYRYVTRPCTHRNSSCSSNRYHSSSYGPNNSYRYNYNRPIITRSGHSVYVNRGGHPSYHHSSSCGSRSRFSISIHR